MTKKKIAEELKVDETVDIPEEETVTTEEPKVEVATKEETEKYAPKDEFIGKIPVATIPNVKLSPEGGYAVKKHSEDVYVVVEKRTGKEVRVYKRGKGKGMVPNPKECAETYVNTRK